VALLLAAMRGASPLALLRDFRAFSDAFEPVAPRAGQQLGGELTGVAHA
jgi:hypothetical protein